MMMRRGSNIKGLRKELRSLILNRRAIEPTRSGVTGKRFKPGTLFSKVRSLQLGPARKRRGFFSVPSMHRWVCRLETLQWRTNAARHSEVIRFAKRDTGLSNL
jgi:hypothetical protein